MTKSVSAQGRRRRGPAPLPADALRTHCVSVRLSPAELAWLDAQRARVRMQRGEYLRAAAIGRLPPTVPELNREAWIELSRAAANLNQLARRLNSGDVALSLAEVRAALADFRRGLIGAKYDAEDVDESEG